MQFPNIPLLRKTVEWVEEQAALADTKRRWYQGTWWEVEVDVANAQQDMNDPLCGTAMCFAGKVAYDAGWTPILSEQDGEYRYADEATKNGVTQSISIVAQDLLGIDDEQASDLFSGSNNASRIRQIAEYIAGERL